MGRGGADEEGIGMADMREEFDLPNAPSRD